MYFVHNFQGHQMEQIYNALGNVNHFRSKFSNSRGSNGSIMFINWFMSLSTDNQLIVTNWVETNYKNL